MLRSITSSRLVAAAIFVVSVQHMSAQTSFPPPPAPPAPGRSGAPIDLTGTWVSIVSEDWIYRMLTPPKGNYASVPLNEEGRRVADSWNLARDNDAGLQCKAFGAAALMRTPTRLQVTWQDALTLRIDADNGTQSRQLHFAPGPRQSLISLTLDAPSAEPSWQGYSVAEWETLAPRGAYNGISGQRFPNKGSLKVMTTRLRAGYLRANGVPYSEKTVLSETFDKFTAPNGDEWIVVTSIVDDPIFLSQPYVTTSHFRKEPDGSKWRPSTCVTPAPLK